MKQAETARARKPTTDAVEIVHRRYIEGRPEMLALLEEEQANGEIARLVSELRPQAGLTRGQLARRVGTRASVIEDLEEADYEGHYLAMLRRIAAAVGKQVEIHVRPLDETSIS